MKKEVHVRRWQVLVAFVALTISFTVGLVLIEYENHRSIDRDQELTRKICANVLAWSKEENQRAEVIRELALRLGKPGLAERLHTLPPPTCR